MINLNSIIKLYDLSIRPDNKHYIVEEKLSGEFFEMPKVCIDAIEMMNKGQTLGEIEQTLKEQYPDEEVDLLSFSEQLVEFGMVKDIDGQEVQVDKKSKTPNGFQWIPHQLGKVFFNKLTITFYILLFVTNVTVLFLNPTLVPNYQDIFIFDSMMFNMITYMSISLVLIIIHEFGHILAVRSHNLPANLSIGHRMILIVFETDLTPAWKLPPKKRNVLYTAGMSFEQVILFVALFISLFVGEGNTLVTSLTGIVIFDIFIKFIYQCSFYMKTDMYYVVENITGCYNLMESGKKQLKKWNPLLRTDDNDIEISPDEKRTIQFYSVFYILGIFFTLGIVAFYFLPQFFYATTRSIYHLVHSAGSPYFWDAIFFVGQILVMLGLLLFVWLKNRTEQ